MDLLARRRTPLLLAAGALALLLVWALALRLAAPAAAAGTPVTVTFNASGTYHVSQEYQGGGGSCSDDDTGTLTWVASWDTTLDNGVLQSGPGSLAAGVGPGTLAMTQGGVCLLSPGGGSCTAQLTSGGGTPTLSASGADTVHILAQSLTGGLSFSGCSGFAQAPFVGSDVSVLNAALPDAATAALNLPKSKVAPGLSTPVSSTDAPGQVASSCLATGNHGSGNVSCSASLSWSGTVAITCPNGIGTITLSEGDAPAQGSTVCKGQSIKTGARSRVEITFRDGSIMRLGSDSEVDDLDGEFVPDAPRVSFRLILGKVWAGVSEALGDKHAFESTSERNAVGVRGSAFTASRARAGGPMTFHAIQGQGFIRMNGKPEVDFPAGMTVIVDGASYRFVTSWPAADQALVPPAQRPPALAQVKLHGGAGANARLSLTLGKPASLLVQVLKGKRVVATFRARGHKGKNTLHPLRHRLPRGSYVIRVSATIAHRVSLVQLTLRV